jgi:hypothetical protein
MDEITAKIFVSDLATASDASALAAVGARRVVSVGCALPSEFVATHALSVLTFDRLHDAPEAPIAAIFAHTNAFVHAALAAGEAVVVHCVYGQSRSAAVVAAYLLSTGMPLDAALALLQAKRPTTCINPGFIAQLLLVECGGGGVASAPVRLICSTYPAAALTSSAASLVDAPTGASSAARGSLQCKACKHVLGSCGDVVAAADVDCAAVLATHTDAYWRGYRPLHAPGDGASETLPIKGCIVTGPLPWAAAASPRRDVAEGAAGPAVDTVFRAAGSSHRDHRLPYTTFTGGGGGEHALHCPRCDAVLGRRRPRGLAICGGFVRVDLYALDTATVALKDR